MKSWRPPKTKVINGERWKIQVVSVITVHGKQRLDLMGACDLENRVIQISHDFGKSHMYKIYLHECLHAKYPRWTEKQIQELEEFLSNL